MAYTVQRVDFVEYKDLLLSLWQRNFQGVNPGRFSWIYEKNPNGPPVVYLLKHEESQSFVGTMALFPRPMLYKGQLIRAYICGDMAVDSQHRSLGPALSLLKAALKQCDKEDPCMLVSFPNNKSEPLTLRLGYKVLGGNCELVKVLKTRKYILRHCNSPNLATFLSWPLDALLRWRYETLIGLRARKYSYELLAQFDARFDPLWEGLKNACFLIGERKCDYLNWRVKESPYGDCRIFSIFEKQNRKICGYVAFHYGDSRASIIDMAFIGEIVNFKMLFFLFSKYIITHGADSVSISIVGGSNLFLEFKNIGFSSRIVKNKAVIYTSFENDIFEKIILDKYWYMTSIDNDI